MIVGVILAAGRSSRMGRDKALLDGGDGRTFLERVAGTFRAAGIDDLVVVVGSEAGEVSAAASQLPGPLQIVPNPRPDDGQLSSLLLAVDRADRPGVEAIAFIPVDMPLVSAGTVAALCDAWRRTHAPVIRPRRDSRHGHPVILSRSLFEELRRADSAMGARVVVRAHAAEGVEVDVEDEGAFIDIDTPEDYERYVRPSE